MLFQIKHSHLNYKLLGFTLVEVIVAITIVAIVTTISFLSYISSSGKARNGARVKNITDITDTINLYITQNSRLPTPDGITSTGVINGSVIVIKGVFGDKVSSSISLSSTPVDPLNDAYYTYSKSYDDNSFQIAATLENENSYSYIGETVFAGSNVNYLAKVSGNYFGYIKYSTGGITYLSNIPSLIYNYSGAITDVHDLFSSGVYFVVDNETNLPYKLKEYININNITSDSIITSVSNNGSATLTGIDVTDIIKGKQSISQVFNSDSLSSFGYSKDVVKKAIGSADILNDTILSDINECVWVGNGNTTPLSCNNGASSLYPKSCNDILTNTGISFSGANIPTAATYSGTSSTRFKNGVYLIDPDGSGTGSSSPVFCDMNDDNGGWTYLINPYSYSTGTSLGLNLTYTAGNGGTCLNGLYIVNPGWPSNYYMYVIYRCAWDTVNSTMSWTNPFGANKLRMVVNSFGNSSYIKLNGLNIHNSLLSAGKNLFAAESGSCSLNACWGPNGGTWRTDVKPRIYDITGDFIVTAGGTGDGNRWGGGAVYTNVAVK